MLVSLKPLMEDAMKKGYAVGAFNCPNMESVMAIIQAAEETNSPVILNYAEVHGNLISMEDIAPVMLQFAKKPLFQFVYIWIMVSLLKVVLKQYS